MSKAIQGAALLGVAVAGMAAMTFATGGLGAIANAPLFAHLIVGAALAGLSMEAGAIAEALTSNRGQNITTKQPASFRQIIYGTQRVGGTIVYQSTTGGHKDQYNLVIVLAGHEIYALENLFLDGRRVYFNGGSGGNSTRNGFNFGGSADGTTRSGPDGAHYNFGGLVYCEPRFGDQALGDIITGLTANDPKWTTTAAGTPSLMGCAYVYLKIEYDTNMFPSFPEVQFTVHGKNHIYDPRTGASGYSTNWALCVADVLTDPRFGLGLDYATWIHNAQLIAAANVCDEYVGTATAGLERRYSTHYHYDTSIDPGSVLETMMTGAAGRLSFIAGEYYIWPAYWQGPSLTFDQTNVTSELTWNPQRSFRDRFNRVNGTYIAPNFPYNVAGDLYDSNGYYDGTMANTFPFAFQPTNYPQYAEDVLHGYASDAYLTQDGGVALPKQISFQTVLSIAQAQRVAKIYLERNRQQGTGHWSMGLECFDMQEADVMQFTFSQMGWTEKTLECVSAGFHLEAGEPPSQSSPGTAPSVTLPYSFVETAASVYEWSASEELSPYDVPAMGSQQSGIPEPPTGLTLTSGAVTAYQTADGVTHPRILLNWIAPADVLTKLIQIQWALTATPVPWIDNGTVDAGSISAYINGVIAGQQYNVRIRGLRGNGGASAWEEIDGYAVSLTLSVVGLLAIAQGALVGGAFPNGTAEIIVEPFTAIVGNATVSVLSAGEYAITGLAQQQLYYVYYVDPTFAGGAITPIATQNSADFLNKPGYFFIGSIVTPYASAATGGSGAASMRYAPSTYFDIGSSTTTAAASAYDGNTSTAAGISSRYTPDVGGSGADLTSGDCIFEGFPSVATTTPTTLYVTAGLSGITNETGPSAEVTANIGGTAVTLASLSDATGSATYSVAVPSGTLLNNVTVEGTVAADTSVADGGRPRATSALLRIFEIYIQ